MLLLVSIRIVPDCALYVWQSLTPLVDRSACYIVTGL